MESFVVRFDLSLIYCFVLFYSGIEVVESEMEDIDLDLGV
jgi:hypothetical protein